MAEIAHKLNGSFLPVDSSLSFALVDIPHCCTYTKGQLISECIFDFLNFPKKR